MTPTNQPQDCNHVWGKEACTKCGKSRFYQPPAETEPGKSVELDSILEDFYTATHGGWPPSGAINMGDIAEAKAAIELLIEERIAEARFVEADAAWRNSCELPSAEAISRSLASRRRYLEAQLPKPLKEDTDGTN